jgi:protoheme IX farnesyltransferase
MRRAQALTDLLSLTKPGVTAMVVITTAAGLWWGAPPPLQVSLATLVATALIVGAANTLNCWWERDSDRMMARTATRPLPAGRMAPRVALGFGLGLAVASLPLYLGFTDVTTTGLAVASLLAYVLIYTPLKRRTPLSLFIGAVSGALPPLIGASAARGFTDGAGWVLFAILFCWQIPHFVAIAVKRRAEYAAAGLKVVAVVRGEGAARRLALLWAGLLWLASLSPLVFGLGGVSYGLLAMALGGAFVLLVAESRRPARTWARRVFLASLVHLTALAVLLTIA